MWLRVFCQHRAEACCCNARRPARPWPRQFGETVELNVGARAVANRRVGATEGYIGAKTSCVKRSSDASDASCSAFGAFTSSEDRPGDRPHGRGEGRGNT